VQRSKAAAFCGVEPVAFVEDLEHGHAPGADFAEHRGHGVHVACLVG
jgi:hypothetical protein